MYLLIHFSLFFLSSSGLLSFILELIQEEVFLCLVLDPVPD